MSKYPDLINTLAIIQGETYLKLLDGAITVSGDWTGVTPRGQIRDTYLNDSEILYAEFEFEESVYDEETDTTTIKPFLSASVTQNIPYTKWREGQVFAPKKNVHVYDIEIEKGSVVKKLAFGYVQVIGEITGSGAPIENKETFLIASNNLSEITDPATARANLEIVGGVKPDWNAEPGSNEEILNQPDLTQYATTTALSEGLATKQSVGNYLDTNDIGVSVQPFSVNTVIDPNYVATEESFTTAEKTALGTALQPNDIAGLAPLTSPNLTGTPTAPTAPEGTDTTQIATTAFVLANAGGGVDNGIVINGVANFWQSTPPTTRVDGSALVDGDRWWNPSTQTNGFWNGTYWLTTQQYVSQFNVNSAALVFDISSSGNNLLHGMVPITEDFFAESVTLQVLTNGSTFDSNNYWTFYSYIQVLNRETDGGNEQIQSETRILDDPYTGTVYIPMTLNYNTAVFMPNANALTLRHYLVATMTGAPSRLRIYGTYLRYRFIL